MKAETTAALLAAFDQNAKMTTDKAHAAACAIHDVIFHGSDKEWNAPQGPQWMRKFYSAVTELIIHRRINVTISKS